MSVERPPFLYGVIFMWGEIRLEGEAKIATRLDTSFCSFLVTISQSDLLFPAQSHSFK